MARASVYTLKKAMRALIISGTRALIMTLEIFLRLRFFEERSLNCDGGRGYFLLKGLVFVVWMTSLSIY